MSLTTNPPPSALSTTTNFPIGRLDIHALDPTCPSWVKLQSIEYGTPLANVALNKPASQSSTYNSAVDTAYKTVDGNDNSFAHTKCFQGIQQWWQVDLEDTFTIVSMEVVGRLDCCNGRLHDYDIYFMDSNMTVVDSIYVPGQNGNRKTISTGKLFRLPSEGQKGSSSYHMLTFALFI